MLPNNQSVSRACLTLIAFLLISASVACRKSASVQRYELKGKVVSVDKRGLTVTIAHQAIPGYMEAMTMTFMLDDQRLLNEMAEGDRIQATLAVGGLRARLEDIIVTREAVDPSNIGKATSAIEPAIGDEVPDFAFVNQDGKRAGFNKYRGRAVVLTFIYTRCPLPDYCPLMTENFTQIQSALKSEPQLYAKTQLLSITVDPEYDTPKVLRGYANVHSAETRQWDFGSGTKDEVKAIGTWFGLQYWPDGDQIVHSLRTAIIDADGKLAKLYRGNEWTPAEIVGELRYLAGQDETSSNPNIHRGVGVIQSVDRENSSVQIDHEPMKDFMPAMDMPYQVKDKSLLDEIAPGDKVDFWLESSPSGSVVVKIHKR